MECLPDPGPGLTLAVAVLAGSAMELVVQKAVELDVRRFVPVFTARSQINRRNLGERVRRWRRISRQTLKQCRRAWEMEILPPVPLSDLTGKPATDLGAVVAHPNGGSVDSLETAPRRLLLVGPEGGFSADEEKSFDAAGWPRLKCGCHVLRSETAAIVGAALLIRDMEE
jgi:16S rRNA (uracil1498-N3)-methyltransferase